ncbi:MAG: trypsin-like peptidase domain-containing protein, partial [Acidimicrobiales bacterium]
PARRPPTPPGAADAADGRPARRPPTPPAADDADDGRPARRPPAPRPAVPDDGDPTALFAPGAWSRPGRPPEPPPPSFSPASPPRRPPAALRQDEPRPSFLRRHFLPPSAFGIVVVVLLIAAGTGFTGAFVWASGDSHNLRQGGPSEPATLGRPVDPTSSVAPTTTTLPDLSPEELSAKLAPSVWTVATFDTAGMPAQAAALVAGTAGGQELLLTSLAAVEASTRQPAPDITVTGPGFNGSAVLWTWEEGRDLALLVVPRSGVPVPPWVPDTSTLKPGDPLFAVGVGGKVAPGVVTGVTDTVVQHNVFVDDSLRGGPLVNRKGQVVALSSAAFTGGGKPTDTTFFGVPVNTVCASVLRCPGGRAPAATTSTTLSPASPTTRGR